MKQKYFFVLIVLFIVGIVVGLGMFFSLRKPPQTVVTLTATPEPTTTEVSPSPELSPSPVAKLQPATGTKTYVDQTLNFRFDYPNNGVITPCQDTPCASIESWGFSVNPLYANDVTVANAKESLMKSDLMCSADGPNGSISCKNTGFSAYTNAEATTTYVISRQKTFTGNTDVPAGTYADTVYVFLLPKPVSGGNVEYSGIMLSVENPTADNLGQLKAVADTFTFAQPEEPAQ